MPKIELTSEENSAAQPSKKQGYHCTPGRENTTVIMDIVPEYGKLSERLYIWNNLYWFNQICRKKHKENLKSNSLRSANNALITGLTF